MPILKQFTFSIIVEIIMICLIVQGFDTFAEELSDWKTSSISGDPVNQKLEIAVCGFPNSIQFGDSVYLICTIKNIGDQPIEKVRISYQYDRMDLMARFFKCSLSLEGDAKAKDFYENLPEDLNGPFFDRDPVPTVPLQPGESRVMYVHTFEFPPLEDIHEPFWKSFLVKTTNSGVRYTMQFITEKDYYSSELMQRTLKHEILIKPRFTNEMELLEQWFSQSHKRHFPVVAKQNLIPLYKHPYNEPGEHSIFSSEDDNSIVVEGKKYSPWVFIQLGNRKPPAHLCPQTWQGWKELEESLSESTMRDEIRLTRIIIQYCDTKDAKVLEELKTWFAGMNEVQRTCMAKSVLDRAKGCYGNDTLLVPYREIYKTIREYDISVKSEFEEEHLKKIGLLE